MTTRMERNEQKSMDETKFAPAGRASQEDIERQSLIFKENEVLGNFLDKVPAVFLIINIQRQIVYMNKGAIDFTGLQDVTEAIAKRPGELLDCIHSHEEPDGCGTAEECTFCGAVNAILETQKTGKPAMREARLLVGKESTAFDLRVYAAPLEQEGETFTAITIEDIRHEKWRTFLERIFFHDILNTASGLVGTIELARRFKGKVNADELLERADWIVQNLIEEIRSQQLLTAAEAKILKINTKTCNARDVLEEVREIYVNHELCKDKSLEIDPASDMVEIVTDKTLLKRILGNMVKNALEAVPDQATITMGCNAIDDRVQFWVQNPGYIPRDVQLQMFKRSFSTKGKDRGLGTYSMKLLSLFLDGQVSFTTSEESGTRFIAEYPVVVVEKERMIV